MSRLLILSLLGMLSACSILPGGKSPQRSSIYLLETHVDVADAQTGCQIIVVNAPITAPGHMGAQMLYQRHPNQIERFAFSRWATSPDAMLEPLLLNVLRSSGRFKAVLAAPAQVRADFRIENDDLWMIQKFTADSSFIELRINSRIYSPSQRKLVAGQVFSYTEPAADATPAAGVAAADRAVQRLLVDYHAFVDSTADNSDQRCLSLD